jgi:hypothetical protein
MVTQSQMMQGIRKRNLTPTPRSDAEQSMQQDFSQGEMPHYIQNSLSRSSKLQYITSIIIPRETRTEITMEGSSPY